MPVCTDPKAFECRCKYAWDQKRMPVRSLGVGRTGSRTMYHCLIRPLFSSFSSSIHSLSLLFLYFQRFYSPRRFYVELVVPYTTTYICKRCSTIYKYWAIQYVLVQNDGNSEDVACRFTLTGKSRDYKLASCAWHFVRWSAWITSNCNESHSTGIEKKNLRMWIINLIK